MTEERASLAGLPNEVIQCILTHVPPGSLAAIEQTSRRFRNPANEPLLWKHHCRTAFRFWSSDHRIAHKLSGPVSAVDWKQLFIQRCTTERATADTLNSILGNQTGRIEKIQKIIAFGYDAKEALLWNLHVGFDAEDVLARRYFSEAVLGCLHRTMALPEWEKLKNGQQVSLPRALGAYDMFVLRDREGDFDDISRRLVDIVDSIRRAWDDIDGKSPRQIALAVASYLRDHDLTGISGNVEYHDIRHNFLGIALVDEDHSSLPLISVAIYCHIARQFKLDAHPCGFPFHVHAIIHPSPGFDMDGNSLEDGDIGESMYMDPFRSAHETPVMNLRSQLDIMGTLPQARAMFLGESSTSEIVLRCGRNILNSVPGGHPGTAAVPDPEGAYYAALWALLVLGDTSGAADGPILRRQRLPHMVEHFTTHYPYDVSLIEQYILPLFQHLPEYSQLVRTMRAVRSTDAIPKQARHRTAENAHVRYKIGQVFRHKRYAYVAVITGWDPQCGQGQAWIQQMGVDRLQRGRHQSFYNVLVADRSVRYVAEENIEIITPEIPHELMGLAGRHFKRWDEEERRFVSNIKDEYPDD